MIAPCVVHIPFKNVPAHVIVVRAGKRLHNPPKRNKPPPSRGAPRLFLQVGDRIFVRRPAVFTFSYGGNRYRTPHATITLKCRSLRIGRTAASPAKRVLAVDLKAGEVRVRSGSGPVRPSSSAERCWRSRPSKTATSL